MDAHLDRGRPVLPHDPGRQRSRMGRLLPRRILPGITLGLANLELALASLLYHFDWDLPGGARLEELDMAEAFGITLRRKSALWVKAKPYGNFMPN